MDDLSHSFEQLPTPAFLADRAVVQRNCDRMRDKAARAGVIFRPHVKTHKTIEIGRMQHGGATGPITVSTMAEAEFFAGAGFDDITYAFPLAPEKIARAQALAARIATFNVLIDSVEALKAIEAAHRAGGPPLDTFLKIDCGYHRAGIDPENPQSVELAKRMGKSPAIRFRGLLTHAGHSYNVRWEREIRAIAREESEALMRFRDRVGLPLIRSVGSTPTVSLAERFDADEIRPGNYVFYDAFQSAIGACTPADCAVSVLTTVVGSYPERNSMIVDAGALALSKDAGPQQIDPDCGFGRVCDLALNPLPLKVVSLSQEHGRVEGKALPVGTKLRIVPNHSCLTAAMFDRYHVISDGAVVGEWRPVRGW